MAEQAADGSEAAQRADRALRQLIHSAGVTQAVFVAAKLGIADLLHDGPRTAAELALATGSHTASLHRVLRALASADIFSGDTEGRFALTAMAELLQSDRPGSLRAAAIMSGERWVWQSWGAIEHSVRTGEPAFEHVFGAKLFDYYTAHPDAGRVSAEALNSFSQADNAAIVAAYDFPAAGIVVDVGGGQGSLLTAILEANTGLHGILFERQPVVKMERPRVEEAGLTDRCDLVAGDFFDAVPACGDLYLLKKVIHDWSDEAAHWILSRCYAAMPPNARLLVSDSIVPAGNRPSPGKWLDLLMLVYAGGRERTETEFRDLLTSAGFRLNRVI